MKHKIKQVTWKEVQETSYHDLVVRASKTQIEKALGFKPIYHRERSKTKYDWYLMLNDKFPFTIYDMSRGYKLGKDDIIEYHIGWKPQYYYNGEFSNQELDDKGFPKQLDVCYVIEALEERGLEVDQSDSWKSFYGPGGYFNKENKNGFYNKNNSIVI